MAGIPPMRIIAGATPKSPVLRLLATALEWSVTLMALLLKLPVFTSAMIGTIKIGTNFRAVSAHCNLSEALNEIKEMIAIQIKIASPSAQGPQSLFMAIPASCHVCTT